MSDIQLHPTKGLNPFMGCCPGCGKDNGELILVGAKDSIYQCPRGHYLVGEPGKCPCGQRANAFIRKLKDGEKIPGNLCKDCETNQKEQAEVVAAGGVYFKCTDCGQRGAIKNNDFSKQIREHAKVEPPNPVGVEFDKTNCPMCSKL